MKAAVYKGNQRLSVEEVPTPSAGAGQVVVKVKYCAICGTDVHAFLYDIAPAGTVMGHEYCGTIAEVGRDVTKWKEGDRVVGGGGNPPPGVLTGVRVHPRFNYRTMGFPENGRLRAYAEYVLMEEWEPVPIPEGVSDEAAALCEPCAVTVHAVRLSDLKLGDAVVVLGAGPIGLLCMQTARAAGATKVIVSEPAPARAEAARRLGADVVLDPTHGNIEERVTELTDGVGPQVVFECAAAPPTLDQALNLAARGGQVVLVAIAWEPTPVLPPDWMAREVRLQASFGTLPEDWKTSLELISAGKVDMAPLLSESNFLPLDDIQNAFEALVKPSTQLQMVVTP
ncbi:MAG: zinc-binding dehydrogenase [Chloroflexi bacterium]|nr:zinc-binding dehydrogenase [Chloroflexota bacterium]